MRSSEVHRGAVAEKLAGPDDKQCDSTCTEWSHTDRPGRSAQCAYMWGHSGPHFRGGEIW
jgi:hypothetical protein